MNIERVLTSLVENDFEVPDRIAMKWGPRISDIGFLIIRPDAVYRGQTDAIRKFLQARAIYFGASKLATPHDRVIEELYRYTQCRLMRHGNRPMWWLTPRYYRLSPCMPVLVVGDSLKLGNDVSTVLNSFKGSSNPALTVPGELRYEFDAQNIVMCVIHSSEDTRSALREAALFFCEKEIDEVMRRIAISKTYNSEFRHFVECAKKSDSADFFSILSKVQYELLSMILPFVENVKMRTTLETIQSEIDYLTNQLRSTRGYLHRARIFTGYWESATVQRNALKELSVTKSEAQDIALVLYHLVEPTKFFSILADELIEYLEERSLLLDPWEQTVLETGLPFHELQVRGFSPSVANGR